MRFSRFHTLVYAACFFLVFSSFRSPAQTLRILPLGNSITEGTDGNPPAESQRISYRFALYSMLTTSGYDFDFVGHRWSGYGIFPDANHGGIPGTRDQYLVTLLQRGYDQRWGVQITPNNTPYLDVYPADIILLHIGTNDITHGEGASPNSVSQILDEIDAWELRTGNEVIVFVARILNRKSYSLTTTQYNNNVAAMVAARNDPNIITVDIENGAGIVYSVDMQDDGIHPYQAGYDKMGQKWFEAIQSLNKPPYFISTPVISATEDQPYTYQVSVGDPNPLDHLTILAGTKPSWLSFTDNGDGTGVLSGIPADNDVGDHPVYLMVSDGKVLASQNFTISVANVNDPPVITGQNPVSTDEDIPFVLTLDDLAVEDPDDPPSGLSLLIEAGTNYGYQGTMVTPSTNYSGTIMVNTKVTDGKDTSNVYQVTVTVRAVNDPPIIVGQKASLEVKHFTPLAISVSDLYYVDVDNNVNDLTVVILPHPDTIYTVEGGQIIPVKDTVGIIEVPVMLDDGKDTSNEFLLQVSVLSLFNPPVFTSTPPKTALVGKAYFYLLSAEDPDEGDILTYRVKIAPGWLDFNPDLKLLGGNPSMQDTGKVWIDVEVTDGMYVVEQLYQLEVRLHVGDEPDYQVGGGVLINSLYPIPASESLFMIPAKEMEYSIQMMDLSGRVIKKWVVKTRQGSPLHLELGGVTPGIYILNTHAGKDTESQKFIVRH
jgi:lysophospholipase L1-like esterase